MAQDIQTLLGQAQCLQCLPAGQQELLAIVLLNNIAGGAVASSIDVQGLLGQAQCLQCLSEGERELIELQLLSLIATKLGV